MIDTALQFVEDNKERFLNELKDLLTIPSISSLPDHTDDIRRAAQWLAAHMTGLALDNVAVMETAGHPVVYADWLHADGKPTVLIYGHYDVQPVDPLDEWTTPPFEPTERDGYLYARGASDDKGQAFGQLKALEAILSADGKLPLNVKIIIEGEEESGSGNFDAYVKANKDLLAADSVVISDGDILAPDQPSITHALRGLTGAEITVRNSSSDLHSGQYGGTIHNPAQAIAEIVAALHNPDGTAAVPGFYDKVRILSEEERAELANVPYTLEKWQSETGANTPWGEADYSLYERTTVRPTLEINGIFGGFSGEGRKTVIPAQAGAKVTMRLVPDQDPVEIGKLFKEYVEQIAPGTVEVEISIKESDPAVVVDLDAPQMQAAMRATETVYGVKPLFDRTGGSIPAVAMFQEYLGLSSILINYGLPDDGIHSPNERFSIDQFHKGIRTLIHYFHELAV